MAKLPKLKKWDGAFTTWWDIKGVGPAWIDPDDPEIRKLVRPAKCITRGFFLWEEKDFIVLCGSIGEKTVSDLLALPKGCIIKLRKET